MAASAGGAAGKAGVRMTCLVAIAATSLVSFLLGMTFVFASGHEGEKRE